MSSYFLYKLTFPNGKVYIGQTDNFKARMSAHKIRKGSTPICNAIRKYNWERVLKEIIMENVHEDMIDMFERFYIGLYKSLGISYNLDSGGTINKRHAKSTINKISKSHIGKIFSKEHITNLSLSHKGKIIPQKQKEKMSENSNWKGKFGKNHVTSKSVLQVDKTSGEIIKEWDSMMDVERALGISHSNIAGSCKNRYRCKTAGGFKWRYNI